MPRPEASGPPANYYDATEAAKYTSSSRIIRVQAEIAARCVELLNFPAGARRPWSTSAAGGLSGAALERAGHAWVGCDVSRDMLRVARARARDDDGGEAEDMDDSEEEEEEEEEDGSEEADGSEEEADGGAGDRAANATAELLEHDMGLGLPFRDGAFDGAVSVSALQWLCYDNDAASSAPRRLNRFFASLYRCLRAGGRAALQFYPENDAQAALIAAAAQRAGFAGGVVVDFPRSTKARKHYLCLSTERRYRAPDARTRRARRGAAAAAGARPLPGPRQEGAPAEEGGRVRPDSKFTAQARDNFPRRRPPTAPASGASPPRPRPRSAPRLVVEHREAPRRASAVARLRALAQPRRRARPGSAPAS